MTEILHRRTRKRLATRQAISDTATRLFIERGFDAVTIGDIAEAADVGRMTVFNHFPRKEDMFFDKEDEAREAMLVAVRDRPAGTSGIAAIQQLAHSLARGNSRALRFFEGSRRFVETIAASDALKARARAIRDELAGDLAATLAETAGRPHDDADAHLAAHLILATWGAAFIQSHRLYRETRDPDAAEAMFLRTIDQGSIGVAASMAGTAFA
jgi:AcrR family transcriptional regulator